MPRKTREEALRTRQKLMDSALEVMCEKPYANVAMAEIAERIGYSKGAIYWHFINKNTLMIQVIKNACVLFENELAIDQQEITTYDAIRAYYKRKLSKPFENERFERIQRLMIRRHEWPEEVQKDILSIFQGLIEKERKMVEKVLLKLRKEGRVRKDIAAPEMALLVTAMFHGMFMFSMKDIYGAGAAQNFEKYTDFVLDAFYKQLEQKSEEK